MLEEQKQKLYGKHKGTIFIDYKGERLTIMQWCKKLGLPQSRTYARYKAGMPIEQIFNKEKIKRNGK